MAHFFIKSYVILAYFFIFIKIMPILMLVSSIKISPWVKLTPKGNYLLVIRTKMRHWRTLS